METEVWSWKQKFRRRGRVILNEDVADRNLTYETLTVIRRRARFWKDE